jgi:decaprenylphospho-beta-D-erythro-pentofuranosid-2-ulose 2-reductase
VAVYRYAIVIGASSGIGAELVAQLANAGCRVAAVARREDRLQLLASSSPERILAFVHDVSRYEEVPELFQRITGELGGLDLVVYAAGVMPTIGVREYTFAKDREVFEVNVLGAMAWLDEAALRFDAVGHGTLLAIGSVAGDRGRVGQPAYNASKAALATYMEALRNRLSRRGVTVVTVKPGPVETEMTAGLHLRGAMPVQKAAQIILAKSARPGEHYLKFSHRVIFWVIRNLPSPIMRRLDI